MRLADTPYEVEFRCHFANKSEAYRALPFLKDSLHFSLGWTTIFYGRELFQSGELLRIAEVVKAETHYYLGWKGKDIGRFANIRQELDEDITRPISESRILRALGTRGNFGSKDEIARELGNWGYSAFMQFTGNSITGNYEPLGIQLKLMYCQALKWPLLVEIEKSAGSDAEARKCEQSLEELCGQFRLQDRVVREEPPTLLFEKLN